MTSLVPQNPEIDLEKDDLSTVLAKVSTRKAVAVPETPTEAAKPLEVPPVAKAAIRKLSGLLRDVEIPTARRELTEDEARELIILGATVKTAEKALKDATAAIKTAVFNHLDVELEEDHKPEEMERDKSGHYLVKGKITVGDLEFCRDLRESSPEITGADLLTLYEAGAITREQYLKATKVGERIVDEEGLMKIIKEDNTVLESLSLVISPPTLTNAFQIRKAKPA